MAVSRLVKVARLESTLREEELGVLQQQAAVHDEGGGARHRDQRELWMTLVVTRCCVCVKTERYKRAQQRQGRSHDSMNILEYCVELDNVDAALHEGPHTRLPTHQPT